MTSEVHAGGALSMHILFHLGFILIAGFFGGIAARKVAFPQIVGYMVAGLLGGVSVVGLTTLQVSGNLDTFIQAVLAIIGFTIGGELNFQTLRRIGKGVFWIVILQAVGAFVLVAVGVWLVTSNLPLALVLGVIATATDPVATLAVIREYRASGNLTSTLIAVVGIDDAIGVIIYGFAAAAAKEILAAREGASFFTAIKGPVAEIVFSILTGILLGTMTVYLLRKFKKEEEVFVLTLGSILIVAGSSISLHLSLILTSMAYGCTLANLGTVSAKVSFKSIERVATPLFLVFFYVAGAQMQLKSLITLGMVGSVYLIARFGGKYFGSYIGALAAGSPLKIRNWIGMALMPQAGVALGLAIAVQHEFEAFGPEGQHIGSVAVAITIASTFVNELAGPFLTRVALFRAGEAKPIQ
ncbi:MAG: hypothetical protein CVV64_17225 [Candidatus Wallbacteria bacterium HGW-Wallbacteria-1]|jgi:NhaP-type Na+/H+ or K+/H+ antiporter|uniref:Cation/H+ exchanger transmembrane domain-containing protein n=1 Tax=Candidatus Wallbacteria bacterium HGW-Wallbacteria-1 TaxID=2013854 RepID=A0A2N1PKG4_9BACT|nr:MAG: hypothetical protein CVV64_17225 [Candidatus Wallbacteria bacterium HGW-Wallbacteria-1]